jgi:hypothetical protein
VEKRCFSWEGDDCGRREKQTRRGKACAETGNARFR